VLAWVVNRWFMVAMKTFARGGVIAMLLQFSGFAGSPLPLYRGIILAVRQDWGGADVIALVFRKFAKLPIPAVPINLSRCGGKILWPRLLVALNFFSSINFNSSYVIK
jgi:hypothetical protein